MSTRRTYEAITRALIEARLYDAVGVPHTPGYARGVSRAALCIAFELGKDNPGFDQLRFLRDVGVTS